METNSVLKNKVDDYKSKAYGYDISKKFEIHQNKLNNEKKANNQIDPNRNKAIEDNVLAYNLWEKQNIASQRNPSKLEDLTRQNQLWIGNSSNNIEKLVYDINSNNLSNMENWNKNILHSNMRKYSPYVLNNLNK
jgi:hypothetical protein